MKEQSSIRRTAGERSSLICFDPNKPNVVWAILTWDSVVNAKLFWASSTAKLQIRDWRTGGMHQLSILEEIEVACP
jgi:hypothetical protein